MRLIALLKVCGGATATVRTWVEKMTAHDDADPIDC
jgi:hypothetical protein